MPPESRTYSKDRNVRARERREHLSRIGNEISDMEVTSSRIDKTVEDEVHTKTAFGGVPEIPTPVHAGRPWLIRGVAVALGFGVLTALIGLQALDRSVTSAPAIVENAPAPPAPQPTRERTVKRSTNSEFVSRPSTLRDTDSRDLPAATGADTGTQHITGIVLDTDGVGIANASVESVADGSSAVTNEHGEFRLPLTGEPGQQKTLLASAGDYQSQQVDIDFRESDGPMSVAFQLPPSERLSGVSGMVQSVDGGDIEGARVNLSTIGDGKEVTTTVDIAGQFNFDSIAEGRYLLTVTAPSPYRTYVAPEFTVDSSGHYLDITLDTLATASVSGVMVDERGQPAAHLPFYAISDGDGHRRFEGVTDANGQFRMEDIPVGALLLRSTTTESDVLESINVPLEGVQGVKVVVRSDLLRRSLVSR